MKRFARDVKSLSHLPGTHTKRKVMFDEHLFGALLEEVVEGCGHLYYFDDLKMKGRK